MIFWFVVVHCFGSRGLDFCDEVDGRDAEDCLDACDCVSLARRLDVGNGRPITRLFLSAIPDGIRSLTPGGTGVGLAAGRTANLPFLPLGTMRSYDSRYWFSARS